MGFAFITPPCRHASPDSYRDHSMNREENSDKRYCNAKRYTVTLSVYREGRRG